MYAPFNNNFLVCSFQCRHHWMRRHVVVMDVTEKRESCKERAKTYCRISLRTFLIERERYLDIFWIVFAFFMSQLFSAADHHILCRVRRMWWGEKEIQKRRKVGEGWWHFLKWEWVPILWNGVNLALHREVYWCLWLMQIDALTVVLIDGINQLKRRSKSVVSVRLGSIHSVYCIGANEWR